MKKHFFSKSTPSYVSHFCYLCRRQTVILVSIFLTVSACAIASPPHANLDNKKDGKEESLVWKLDATINNVSFYHALSECNGRKIAFLKFDNKNNVTTSVSWKETVKTQLRAEEKAIRGEQRLSLPPGETFETSCAGTVCKACVILPEQVNPTYLAQIVDFSFTDITVSK